jgi:hypothetical protein
MAIVGTALAGWTSLISNFRRAAWIRIKGIVEKTIEAVEEFASDVRDAAKHMMDPPGAGTQINNSG